MTKHLSQEDTIAAIATAPGISAIQIVRISGPKALDIAESIFLYKKSGEKNPHQLYLGWVVHGTKKIDQALCVLMPAPRSYTGEDIVELHLHGSPVIAEQALTLCLDNGARLALPGEFTKRAFLNGKLDLTQAEAIGEIIKSDTIDGASLGADQLAGSLKLAIIDTKRDLVSLAAHYTAALDFSEEDIASTDLENDKQKISELQEEVSSKLTNANNVDSFKHGYTVSLIGLPNAGKSTLLNTLLGYERAIVTDIAGTTRDTLAETIQLGTTRIKFTDTAGLRDSGDTVEQLGIERSIGAHKISDLNLLLVEPGQEKNTYDYIHSNQHSYSINPKNTLVIFTKQDISKVESSNQCFGEYSSYHISAKDNKGIDVVKNEIQNMLASSSLTQNIQLLTKRQVQLLTKLSGTLEGIKTSLQDDLPADIILVQLQSAITVCNQITGEDTTQEIIDEVFSNFCIGK